MGAFGGLIQTNKGRNLQAKAEAGAQLKFTRMGVGDGQIGGQSIPSLNKLIHETMSLPITRLKAQLPAQAVVGAVLSNQDVTTGFYFRELGIFAQDPDEGEILYAYGNSGSGAEYIPPAGTADIIEKTIDMIVTFGQAQNVSAVINSSLIFATPDDVAEALTESKKYTDEKIAGVNIPDASLTTKGKVQLSNSTNSIAENMAATPKAVKDAYDRGSAGVTAAAAAQAKADAAETPAGAQAKANAAETNAKNYVDGKGWQKAKLTSDNGSMLIIPSGTSLNDITTTGFYNGVGLVNTPNGSSTDWFYIEVLCHTNSTDYVLQRAYHLSGSNGVNPTYYQRMRIGGNWTAWSQDLFTSVANGKQAIASAISGKGVAASGSDEFAVLANKIGQIRISPRKASGQINASSSLYGITYTNGNTGSVYVVTVNGLDFTPRAIILDDGGYRILGYYSVDIGSFSQKIRRMTDDVTETLTYSISGNLYVNSSGFRLPAGPFEYASGIRFNWYAYE